MKPKNNRQQKNNPKKYGKQHTKIKTSLASEKLKFIKKPLNCKTIRSQGKKLTNKDIRNYKFSSKKEDPNKAVRRSIIEKLKTGVPKKKLRKRLKKELKDPAGFKISLQIKKRWEHLRDISASSEKKNANAKQLYESVKPNLIKYSHSHDMSRVIETCLKYGDTSLRSSIFQQLKSEILTLSVSRYGRFLVKKLLTYCGQEEKLHVISQFQKSIRMLIMHSYGCELLDTVYVDHATSKQKLDMIQNLYAPHLIKLKLGSADKVEVMNLKEFVIKHSSSRDFLMTQLRDLITKIQSKALFQYSITHRLFLEYFKAANDAEVQDLAPIFKEHLQEILHTSDGSQVTNYVIANCNAKDRKVIIKAFSSFVPKILKEEFGHRVLLTLFCCVDDTILLRKCIVNQISSNLSDYISDKHAKRVVLFLINPLDTHYFSKEERLQLLNFQKNEFTKKDQMRRSKELFESINAPLLKYTTENLESFYTDKKMVFFIVSICESQIVDGKVKDFILDSIVELCSIDFFPAITDDKLEDMHIVENPFTNLLLKTLLKKSNLADKILSSLSPETLCSWLKCNRGCLLLTILSERNEEKMREVLATKRKSILKLTFPASERLKEICNGYK